MINDESEEMVIIFKCIYCGAELLEPKKYHDLPTTLIYCLWCDMPAYDGRRDFGTDIH